jgi:hypothetical protein
MDDADRMLRTLIPTLRSYDLVLNEAKSVIMPKSALLTEEPDLEALFANAVDEIASQIDDEDYSADYGFQSEWDDDEEVHEQELELQATQLLFNSVSDYPGQEENIERFCLPLFASAGSDYAVSHVLDSFKKRPSMSQIYAAYLVKFLGTPQVDNFLMDQLQDSTLVDWQRMWVLAALMQADRATDSGIKSALDLLKDANRHDSLRAVAAVYVGSFGDHTRRKALVSLYPSVSSYVQSAIYYASARWPGVEKRNAKASWSAHSALNILLTNAINKKYS